MAQTYKNVDLDKIAENVDYSQNFRKMSTWVKICKYLDFGQNFLKISIFIKIFENIACGENCWKIWNLVKIFGKSRFWSKFTKMSILIITEEKILTLVEIFKKTDFGKNKFENLDFG